ncbi:hypothetical protein M1373_02555 [Candidatus Marsarchaeota archaeon]|nr:hypothetical protein [Candidatus Marsarchaeota archaeon]MCL5404683.1 hypothetical protein [Candidatus Marsarchaeota archaeon]
MVNENHSIIKRLVFKLIKKHIAGSTTASVLRAIKLLNERSVGSTVTFLSENALTTTKVRYNINSYFELIRNVTRQNLDADISVRLTQLGYLIGKSVAVSALQEIGAAAARESRKVWIESEEQIPQSAITDAYKAVQDLPIGIELPLNYTMGYWNGSSSKRLLLYKAIKFTTMQPLAHYDAQAAHKKLDEHHMHYKDMDYYRYIKSMIKEGIEPTVLSHDEKFLMGMLNYESTYKRHLRLEVPLGYNKKRFGMMLKSKPNLSVYVAYGKDWVPYAINRLTEGRIREIASALLEGESKGALHAS